MTRTPEVPIWKDILAWLFRLALSFGSLMLSAMLLLFGIIVFTGNDGFRRGLSLLLIIPGLVIFTLGPRTIKRITGKDPIDPPPFA